MTKGKLNKIISIAVGGRVVIAGARGVSPVGGRAKLRPPICQLNQS
jgi:hypothetical protein